MSAFAVIYNKKPSIRKPAEEIISQLKKNGFHIVSPRSKDALFTLALGGDGTVLRAVSDPAYRHLPIISVKLGRIGFLAELSPKNIVEGVEKALKGAYTIDSRRLLHAAIYRHGRKVAEGQALNDVVIHSARLARIVHVDTFVNNKRTATYRADGVIISSATGSTAYNLSAGGPILDPRRKEIIVTPICPHVLKWKSQLIAPGKEVKLVSDFKKGQSMVITFDGQKHFNVRSRDEIIISLSTDKVDFIRFKPYNFRKVLKEKLS